MDRLIQFLLVSLKDSESSVREAASEALERFDIRSRIGLLKKKVECGKKVEKIKAIYTLGRIRGDDVFDLLSLAMRDPVEDVRAAALRVVNGYHKIDNGIKDILIGLLDDPSEVVRREVLEVLGNLGESDYVENIIGALGDEDSGVVEKAAEALGKIGDKRALAPLIECAQNSKPAIRAIAIRSMGNLTI